MTAKEMFDKLGYEYTTSNEPATEEYPEELRYIVYSKETEPYLEKQIELIWFDVGMEEFYKQTKECKTTTGIRLQEYKAIQQQIKELGWEV